MNVMTINTLHIHIHIYFKLINNDLDPTKRWYLGCYIPTLPGPVPSKLYIDDSSLIPAKCSNMCAEQR